MGYPKITRAGPAIYRRAQARHHGALDDERVAAVEEWADAQGDKPSRPEAIRRLVELGLKGAKGKTK
jgi:hypothetical protein